MTKLYLGIKFTGITVQPDEKYPDMYRVHWPDRPPSDMVNLARAKDAAMRWAGREGGETAKRLKWRTPESPPGGGWNDSPAPGLPARLPSERKRQRRIGAVCRCGRGMAAFGTRGHPHRQEWRAIAHDQLAPCHAMGALRPARPGRGLLPPRLVRQRRLRCDATCGLFGHLRLAVPVQAGRAAGLRC